MTENYIQLKKGNLKKFGIKDEDGNPTGEYLVFDMNDIELPLKYQELQEKNKKNHEWIRNQILIIEKRQDVKGKKLMSKNEEDKVKAYNEFYKREIEVYNMFLGENAVEKILCGRKIGIDIFAELDEMIENIITPQLELSFDGIKAKITEKYEKLKAKAKDQVEVIR